MSTIWLTARSQFLQRHREALCLWTEGDNKEGMRKGLTRRPEETKMLNSSQNTRFGAPRRCAICEGSFGLIRYYSWRTSSLFKEVR